MRETKRFFVKEEHLKLLRAAWVDWQDCEFGAPAIDCKRPYGNSDVLDDIAEICGWPHPEAEWPAEYEEVLRNWHRGTQTALAIILATGLFETGTFEADRYDRNWRKVG